MSKFWEVKGLKSLQLENYFSIQLFRYWQKNSFGESKEITNDSAGWWRERSKITAPQVQTAKKADQKDIGNK